jgi:epoxyqueuosine reductase
MEASSHPAREVLSAKIKMRRRSRDSISSASHRFKLPPHGESFARWLRDGFAGELGYMSRTEGLRRDPHELVPWAQSIVSVGMNYYTPNARPDSSAGSHGWISRYAWGDDYHALIQERLERLLEAIRALCGEADRGARLRRFRPGARKRFRRCRRSRLDRQEHPFDFTETGSWFFLGELFVDLALAYDRPNA